MKTTHLNHQNRAFTALELLVVLAVIFTVFVLLVLPGIMNRPKHRGSAAGIKCSSNLKQIALSFKMFAGDNNSQFPYKARGSLAYTNDTEAWLHFLSLFNELGSTKILLCPTDYQSKTDAQIFGHTDTNNNLIGLSTVKNSAISYFVGLEAKESTSGVWLTGDGRLGAISPMQAGPMLVADERTKLRWFGPLHERGPKAQACPNVALADGSVSSGSNFISAAKWPSSTTNRLLLPQ